MKVYTKTGDDGSTALFGGDRVSKSYIRVESYGNIDELNSFLGLLIVKVSDPQIKTYLSNVQHVLFNVGSVIATVDPKFEAKLPALHQSDIDSIERSIDEFDSTLPPMTNFILPGGSEAISLAHVCRTICRRAERSLVALTLEENVSEGVKFSIQFLNRLSDYFFVLSRKLILIEGVDEVIWKKEATL